MLLYFSFYTIICILIWIVNEQTLFGDILITFNFINLLMIFAYVWIKKGGLMHVLIIFNIIGFLYTNYIPLYINANLDLDTWNCIILSTICISSFNVAYICSELYIKDKKIDQKVIYNYKMINKYAWIIFILGISIEIYFLFYNIGLSNFMELTRAGRSLLMQESFYLANFYKYFISLAFLLFFIAHMHSAPNIKVLLGSLALCILNAVISISRSDLVLVLIPIIYILYSYKRINNMHVSILGTLLFIFMAIWKYWLSENVVFSGEAIQLQSELGSWIAIGTNIIRDLDQERISYLWGSSYIEAFINLIVPFIGFEPLSRWYVRTYEYGTYILGGGRGFSSVIEAYYNFNIIGCIFVYFLYGILLKKLFSMSNSSKNILIQAVAMSVIFKLFRSEAYSLWKNVWWLQILPIIVIFELSKKKAKNDEK